MACESSEVCGKSQTAMSLTHHVWTPPVTAPGDPNLDHPVLDGGLEVGAKPFSFERCDDDDDED